MISLFFAFTSSAVIELTKVNVNEYIGGQKTSFVKFYSPNCGHCSAMAPAFEEASTTFTEVSFAGVDCINQKDICDKHKVTGYPTIFLFKPGDKTGIEFKGERSADGFDDFIENYTTFKAKRPPKVLVDLNPLNFQEQVNNRTCTFVTFFAPWCGHCKHFLPEAKAAALAFMVEPNVEIGRLNCEQYKNFCEEHSVTGYPTIKLFKNTGEQVDYSGPRTSQGVADFLNEHCGTQRGTDGLLIDTAGLLEGAAEIVKEFLSGDKKAAREKMAALEGSQIYLKVMDRYIEKGVDQIRKDVATMKSILDAKKGSAKALDGMKSRFNVFNQFIPVQEQVSQEIKNEL